MEEKTEKFNFKECLRLVAKEYEEKLTKEKYIPARVYLDNVDITKKLSEAV